VLAIGVGSVDGGWIPADSGAPSGPWHLDGIGRAVVSRLDETALRRIGGESGGAYARWDDPAGLEVIGALLATLEAKARAARPASEPRERFQIPLVVGIILLVVAGLPVRARRQRPRDAAPAARIRARAPRRLTVGIGTAIAVILLVACSTRTREETRGRRLYDAGRYLEAYETWQAVVRQQGGADARYNSGNALYRLHHYADAAKTWRDAMGGAREDLKQHAFYNMGNAFVRAAEDANALSGYLERAVDAYEEALRLDPGDEDAKWNLELALQRRGDVGQEGSRGRGGRADYGVGSRETGYEGTRDAAVGAMAGGGQGGDEGESVDELDPDQARALLDAVERQQLSTHEGRRPRAGAGGERDW
jgi:Ca-activated chloride channel family protein